MPVESSVYPNVSKLFDSEGAPLVPSAYSIEEFTLINIDGKDKNITEFITSFNIIEELFSPVIICNINIRDDENLFADLQLSGQEKINLSIKIIPIDGNSASDEISLEFLVKEYPNFRKTTDAINVQEYSLVAISNFAYISQLTRISKAIPDPRETFLNPIDEIKYIFENNLKEGLGSNYSISISEDVVSKFKGNITLRSPLAAIEFLRTKSYDVNNAPFFVYNKISGGMFNHINIESLTSILEKPVYYANGDQVPYNYTAGFVNAALTDPGDSDYYKKLKLRILSLNANLKINKLKQGSAGVYGNSLQIYRYAFKDTISHQFDPYATAAPNPAILPGLAPQGTKPFANLKYNDDSKGVVTLGEAQELSNYIRTELHLPPAQTPADINSGFKTAPEIYVDVLNNTKYYYSRLQEDQNIEIEVYGDFNFNPGVKIQLVFPKAQMFDDESTGGDEPDPIISGLYIIIFATHEFRAGLYTTRLNLIKLVEEDTPQ